jgi:hypothetical protein
VKLHLDEDLSPVIAEILRRRGLDVSSAHEVGTTQLSDAQQLHHTTQAERVLVTRNLRDFVVLAGDYIARGQAHAGIILVPAVFRGNEFAAIADAIERIVAANPDGLRGAILFAQRE